MSKRIFTKEQTKELIRNGNVQKCSSKSITYRKDFKVWAVKKYHNGLSPAEIFRQAKFNIDLIGRKTPKRCLQSWRKIFKAKGIHALSVEARGRSGGRPKINWSDDKEKIKYLEAQVSYLKAENDFLTKLRKER